MTNRTVLLNRDGAINVNGNYLDDPDNFKMYLGVDKVIKKHVKIRRIL